MEQVNHPKHYNQHPAGIECIDIIRHYTCDIANALKYLWRAGLKPEMGKEDAEKEIEDLKKAVWYIEDYLNYPNAEMRLVISTPMHEYVHEITGHTVDEIIEGYEHYISIAMSALLVTGLIHNKGIIVSTGGWEGLLRTAISLIQDRILAIEHSLLDKELNETIDVMNGKAIDGEEYVSKPGCVRETEPEKYDPLNMIVAWGRVYSLTDEIRKKGNGALYGPCDNCDLSEFCASQDGTESLKNLCNIHQAQTNEYYREVGIAKYSPRFGTVEVVDEHKELDLELKRQQEEEED